MAMSHVSEVIQRLRRTMLLLDGAGMTDGQLLSRFLEARDEDAFAALVKRHGPMVWGVCRRLLADHHDAEDAFQATFLVLVRKAATVLPRERIANWLHGVAYMTAHRAKVAAAKARRRERQFAKVPEPAVSEPELWDDLRPLLDQELTRLPDPYRVVVVLCDLEGKTRKEAARQLDLPEGTVASRLARARAMLAKRLARHGLGLSGGALAAVLSQKAASASVPLSVVSATIKAARRLAAGQAVAAGAISVKVAALTEGVLKTMFLNKTKAVATGLFLLAIIGLGGRLYTHGKAGAQPGRVDQPANRSAGEEGTGTKDTTISKLQGRWVAVSAEVHGHKVREDAVKAAQVTLAISGDRLTATAHGVLKDGAGAKQDATLKGVIKVDTTKKPGQFDLVDCCFVGENLKELKTGGLEGIYELTGDTLRVCYGPARERPTEFKTKPASSQKLYVFEREKPKKPGSKSEKQREAVKAAALEATRSAVAR
jgi:RNA polymerase sigma factor (sigma-70 family)